MDQQAQAPIRVGFVSKPETGLFAGTQTEHFKSISALDLAETLDAFQKAVYATVLYQSGGRDMRNLTDEMRRNYSLQVVGYDNSCFFSLLTPENLQHAVTVLSAVGTAINFIKRIAEGHREDPRFEHLALPYWAEDVKVGLKRNRQFVCSVTTAEGHKIEFRTMDEGNKRVMARVEELGLPTSSDEDDPEVPQGIARFANGRVLDIMTTDNALVVTFPYFESGVICTYSQSHEHDIARHLHALEVITVIGRVVQVPRSQANPSGLYIEVIGLEDSHGNMIINPSTPA